MGAISCFLVNRALTGGGGSFALLLYTGQRGGDVCKRLRSEPRYVRTLAATEQNVVLFGSLNQKREHSPNIVPRMT
jgi:hypothetical protein